MIDWLTNGSQAVRRGAIAHLQTVPVHERSSAVQEAVLQELTRLNSWVRQRADERRGGGDVPATPESSAMEEYRLAVAQLVTESPNLRAIPALLGALDIGPSVSRALSGYGEQVVPQVARIARDGAPDTQIVEEALRTMQFMIESKTVLSLQARDLMLSVTVERVTGKQNFLIAGAACRLAVATGDLALRRRVEQLATDASERAAMGLTARQSEVLRETARGALVRAK